MIKQIKLILVSEHEGKTTEMTLVGLIDESTSASLKYERLGKWIVHLDMTLAATEATTVLVRDTE